MATHVFSFGFKHGAPLPTDALVLDIRQLFRNPHHDRKLRYMRGTDAAVQSDVRRTPDFRGKLVRLINDARAHAGPVYIGCTAGRHRSVYLALVVAAELNVPVTHLHIEV